MSQVITHVVGARPNFVKIAPIYRAIAERDTARQVLIHTGQHYDPEMSGIFFEEFGLPEPDVNLAVGSGTHAVQTAQVMTRIEPVLDDVRPDWLVVVGDVNSTIAAALVAAKKGIRVAHVEAGLRSFDWTMPEEVNRVLTDRIADLLLTPSRDGDENLRREGIDHQRIRFVGNVMIDTLVRLLPRARDRWSEVSGRVGADAGDRFALVTLHRPGNVDDPDTLAEILAGLRDLSQRLPVIFPVHPRTRARMDADGLDAGPNVRLVEPLGYIDFLALTAHAALVVTDSGGIQEETTYLGIPCLTVRPNTERPVTVTEGTNRLVQGTRRAILDAATRALASTADPGRPALWDGRTAGRIADALGVRAAQPTSTG